MEKMTIDGKEFQADEAVVARVQKLEKELKDAQDGISAVKADLDKVTAERDAAKAECEKLSASCTDEAISAKVAEKLALVDSAKKLGAEVKAEDSVSAIRSAVVKLAFGDSMNLDGKSAEYLSAIYDAAVVSLGKKAEQPKSALEPELAKVADSAKNDDPDAAYAEMCGRLAGKKINKEG